MEQKIKELRLEIDGVGQLVKDLKGMKLPLGKIASGKENKDYGAMVSSPETIKCYDSLRFAKAHLGKVLGLLNVDTPYKNDGKRKTVDDIEPTADKNNMAEVNNGKLAIEEFNKICPSHIEKVDFLRQRIKDIASKIDVTDVGHPLWTMITQNPSSVHFIFNAFNHLTEARFDLGFELERIREEKDI